VNALLRLVRRLATAPGFRRLKTFSPLIRVSFALRGILVRSPLRFALNELRSGEVVASYRLRKSEVSIVVRHHTPDVLALDEVFSQQEYAPPEAIEKELRGIMPLRVVDLGANIGLFGAWVLSRYPNAQVVAIEADSGNAAVHERAQGENDLGERWTLTHAVAATKAGTARATEGRYTTAAFESYPEGDIVTIDVFPLLKNVDWLKIDIEGGEWTILADERFQRLEAKVVVLEYHSRNCPTGDPMAVATETLRSAGYEVTVGAAKPRFGAGLLWGLKRP
jgi:FkbM family methyltransferase